MSDYIKTYAPAPAPAGVSGNPDAYASKTKTGSTIPSVSSVAMQIGKQGGKDSLDYGIFIRFELDVPKWATITAISVNLFANGGGDAAGGSTMGITGGFLVPQDSGNAWEDETGVIEWAGTPANIPFAEWDDGGTIDYGVFHGGARAFTNVSAAIQASNGGSFSFGEGVSAHTSVTGLVDQLQSYIDDNEALRDHTLADHIPAMFHFYRPYDSEEEHWQGLHSTDQTGTATDPSLTVHYSTLIPPSYALVGSATSTQTSEGSGVSTLAAEGLGTSTQEIAGEGVSTTSMTGSGTSKTELEGG